MLRFNRRFPVAWYTAASATVSVAANNTASAITTVDSKLEGIDVKATWGSETNLDALPLTHLGNQGEIETYVINPAGNLVQGTLPAGNVGYGSAVVSFGVDDGKNATHYIPYTGNYTAKIKVNQGNAGYEVRIGSVSNGKFTDATNNEITVTFKIDASGNITGSQTVYVRVEGGSIENLGSPEDASGSAGATTAKIYVDGATTRTGNYA